MSDPKTSPDGKPTEADDPQKDVVEDAVILDEPVEVSEQDADSAADTPSDETSEDATEEATGETDGSEELSETADKDPEPVAAETVPVANPAPKQRGFFPVFLGGVAAAAIGAAGALVLFPNGIGGQDDTVQQQILADLAAQTQATEALKAELASLSLPPDLTAEVAALREQLATVTDPMAQDVATHGERIEMLSALVGDLEKRPIANNLAPEAIAAYERELKALQAAMAEQRAQVEAKLEEAKLLAAAAEVEANAASARDALALLAASIDNGAPLVEALSTLEAAGIAAPEGLSAVAEGVPTLAALQDEFPTAARAALGAARKETGDTGVMNFFRDQLGVRSLTPQEGESADAVLSRAEAALKDGDLATALTEIAALPDGAAAAMSEWQVQATLRGDALAALSALRQSVMTN